MASSADAPDMNWQRAWPWLAGAALFVVVVWLLTPILMPFVLGAGLAYLGDPIVDRLQTYRMSRTFAVCVVFVTLFLVGLIALLLVVPLLVQQIAVLLQNVPEWLRWLQDVGLPKIGVNVPAGVRLDAEGLRKVLTEHWDEASGIAKAVVGQVSKSGPALLAFAANLLLLPVVTFYLLRDWDDLVRWVADMIPRRLLPKVTELARETDFVLAAFIRGQLSVMLALAVIYTLGLWLAGVDLALLIGVGAGLVSFVPYLGFIAGFATASIAVLLDPDTQGLLPLLWVGLVFGVGQVIESAVLTPWLVGDRIGLHPVAVIFAVMAGGQLFGFVGILLALPAAAVVAVLLRHAKQHWLTTPWYLSH